MRVYYFTNADCALNDIEKNWVKVSPFSTLNDPFELFAGSMHGELRRKKMRTWAADLDRRRGLLCFSEDWHDPLMWSHYGDRHRGICLGFDVDDGILKKINYSPERLRCPAYAGSALEPTREIEDLLLTTKFARWNYERERRVIVSEEEWKSDNDLRFRMFDPGLNLARIIVRPRCTKENKINDALRKNDALRDRTFSIEVIKSRLAFQTFRVVRNKQGF